MKKHHGLVMSPVNGGKGSGADSKEQSVSEVQKEPFLGLKFL